MNTRPISLFLGQDEDKINPSGSWYKHIAFTFSAALSTHAGQQCWRFSLFGNTRVIEQGTAITSVIFCIPAHQIQMRTSHSPNNHQLHCMWEDAPRKVVITLPQTLKLFWTCVTNAYTYIYREKESVSGQIKATDPNRRRREVGEEESGTCDSVFLPCPHLRDAEAGSPDRTSPAVTWNEAEERKRTGLKTISSGQSV